MRTDPTHLDDLPLVVARRLAEQLVWQVRAEGVELLRDRRGGLPEGFSGFFPTKRLF